MVAFVRYTDPLLVTIDSVYFGTNVRDNRATFHPVDEINYTDGGLTGTQWYKDSGVVALPLSEKEPRAFCTRGGLNFTFTGSTLLIRMQVSFSWFRNATVMIDGQVPSTMGLLFATDTLSSDSATYGLNVDAYVDVIIADGLAPGTHLIEVVIDNPNPSKFFSIAGYKISGFVSVDVDRPGGWIVIPPISQNFVTFTITNRQIKPVVNITLGFPAGLTLPDGSPVAPLTTSQLNGSESVSTINVPIFGGQEHSGPKPYSLSLTGTYPDPLGTLTLPVTITAAAGTPLITFIPSPWDMDNLTPDGETRAFADLMVLAGELWSIPLTFSGDDLALTVQQSAGWGDLGIYDSDNATLLQSVPCGVDVGGVLTTFNLIGFGAGTHDVFLRKTAEDGNFVVFIKAVWVETGTYTQVNETFDLIFEAQQPYAMPVQDVVWGDYDATFDPPILTAFDYSGVPVRENFNAVLTETLFRFPTFAVCYQSGFRDTLQQYDVLIVDPLAASVADVQYWQGLGIKVFGYIASTEEVGSYVNRYDFFSALGPLPGTGPGGFAAYYMYTKNPTTGPPDKNGIWASFFINTDPAFGWPDRVESYYYPQLFGGPVVVTNEAVVTHTATISTGTVIVFDTAQVPIDSDQPIILTTADGSITYRAYYDFTFNVKTGAFVLSTTIVPPVIAGDTLLISYTRKGHRMDGVFWDVLDNVDTYGSSDFGFEFVPGYEANVADLIHNFAAAHPDVLMIYNRGFTVLPQIVQHCCGVMFESWLTLPTDIGDLVNTDYFRITDEVTIIANEANNQLLRDLRMKHVFDVYSLNYARVEDTVLNQYCRNVDADRGYLSWQTLITLTTPNHNTTISTPEPDNPTNAFRVFKKKAVVT